MSRLLAEALDLHHHQHELRRDARTKRAGRARWQLAEKGRRVCIPPHASRRKQWRRSACGRARAAACEALA